MSRRPRRWCAVVGRALLEAADQYQQCRRDDGTARPVRSDRPASCAAPSSG